MREKNFHLCLVLLFGRVKEKAKSFNFKGERERENCKEVVVVVHKDAGQARSGQDAGGKKKRKKKKKKKKKKKRKKVVFLC